MAHKKAGSSTSLGRDSHGQRLGVKLFAGQVAKAGMVVVRQRGTKFRPSVGVAKGSDDTIFATEKGTVKFGRKLVRKFTGKLSLVKTVSVVPTVYPEKKK